MGVVKLSTAGILDYQKYSSFLAGNAAFSPSSYDLLETEILTSTAATITFSGLDAYSDYQHLQVRLTAKTNRTSADVDFLEVQVNGDTANNYSWHYLLGDGSVSSSAGTNDNVMRLARVAGNSGTDVFGAGIIDFLDAYNTSKYLTTRCLAGVSNSNKAINLNSGSWRNTNAITSITFLPEIGTSILADSRFSLYGLKAA